LLPNHTEQFSYLDSTFHAAAGANLVDKHGNDRVQLPGKDGVAAADDICRDRPTAVVLTSDSYEPLWVARALGNDCILACLTKPLAEAALGAALAVAHRRFECLQSLRAEAEGTRQALKERKLIERALARRELRVSAARRFTKAFPVIVDILHSEFVPASELKLPTLLAVVLVEAHDPARPRIDGRRQSVKLGMTSWAEYAHVIPVVQPAVFTSKGPQVVNLRVCFAVQTWHSNSILAYLTHAVVSRLKLLTLLRVPHSPGAGKRDSRRRIFVILGKLKDDRRFFRHPVQVVFPERFKLNGQGLRNADSRFLGFPKHFPERAASKVLRGKDARINADISWDPHIYPLSALAVEKGWPRDPPRGSDASGRSPSFKRNARSPSRASFVEHGQAQTIDRPSGF
jgi:hypothetical protein